jgi:predicted dinucleotide-binding enzyme
MKIGIIGAGNIGGTLGRRWAAQGHQLMFGVRDPHSQKIQDLLASIEGQVEAGSIPAAAAFGDLILLAVPGSAALDIISQAGDLSGKILVDANNRIGAAIEPGRSLAEELARQAPGARLVKAFNTTGYENMLDPQFGPLQADMFICGDDPAAKAVVAQLAEGLGFHIVDTGPLSSAALLEALAGLWVHLAYRQGLGRNITFKLLTR